MTHMLMSVRDTSRHRRVTYAPKHTNEITLTPRGGCASTQKDCNKYKIHITLEITEVAKVPMVAGSPPVLPQVAGVDKPVLGMAAAIGAVRGSAKGRAQNLAGGRLEDPVEGIPRTGKETLATDTGTSTPQYCRG